MLPATGHLAHCEGAPVESMWVYNPRLRYKQPGISAGCVIESLKAKALIGTIEDIVDSEEPVAALRVFTEALKDTLEERSSTKHMAGLDLGRLEGTPSLNYRAAA